MILSSKFGDPKYNGVGMGGGESAECVKKASKVLHFWPFEGPVAVTSGKNEKCGSCPYIVSFYRGG